MYEEVYLCADRPADCSGFTVPAGVYASTEAYDALCQELEDKHRQHCSTKEPE